MAAAGLGVAGARCASISSMFVVAPARNATSVILQHLGRMLRRQARLDSRALRALHRRLRGSQLRARPQLDVGELNPCGLQLDLALTLRGAACAAVENRHRTATKPRQVRDG